MRKKHYRKNRSPTSDKLRRDTRKKDFNSQRSPLLSSDKKSLRRKSLVSTSPKVLESEPIRSPFPTSFFNTTPLQKVEVCQDRQERKEVLFAKGFAGSGKVKKANWTAKSYVRCN